MIYTQTDIASFFHYPKQYRKTGHVACRLAEAGEQIVTILDGEIETTNVAQEGDLVVRGPKGEEYILTESKFSSRYSGPAPTGLFQTYEATGTTFAVQWPHGPTRFTASWGETMIINHGDYLCSPTEVPSGDIYRIEREVFEQTYFIAEATE